MARRELPRLVAPRKLRLPGIPREPRGFSRSEATFFPRGLRQLERFTQREPAGDPPGWWLAKYPSGTKPEWAIFWALLRLGLKEDEDFFVHAALPGVGRSFWSQVDFLVPPYQVGIEVQGTFWHYGLGSERQQRDILRIAYFAERGLRIVFIDEDDALRDPIYYTREALAGNDHSKLRRGT